MAALFDRHDRLPSALADIGPRDIRSLFPRPALVEIAGEPGRPLFLSTLLHGNETTSFHVLQALARRYADAPPPRSLQIFIGNVEAAEAGQRFLDSQPDFNRIWAGGISKHHRLVAEIIAAAQAANPFASIDIHNNTGRNPYYGCVNALRPADLRLATFFSDICVYYRNPPTTQSIAFSRFCPAVTIECGQSAMRQASKRRSTSSSASCGSILPQRTAPGVAISALRNSRRRNCRFGCVDLLWQTGADIVLRSDIETLNFVDIEPGATWALSIRDPGAIRVTDEHGNLLTEQFLAHGNGGMAITRHVTPAMLTCDREVIRNDCLCYFMRRL